VNLQHGVIKNLEHQLSQAHQNLLQAEYRLAGFKQVLKGRKLALRGVQQRREQRITDEFAAMRHARGSSLQSLEEHL
jgi:flagellar FliJ protein